MLGDLAQQVGAPLTLVNYATYTAPPHDPLTVLHTAALTDGRSAVRHFKGEGYYGASHVISSVNGEIVALLDARLSGAEFAGAVHSFNRVLMLAAFIVAAIAGLAGVLYGRWLARPVIAPAGRGAAHRARRFRHGNSGWRADGSRCAREFHGRDAPQSDCPHRRAAAARGGGARGTRRDRRGCLRSRRGTAQFATSTLRARDC